MIPTGQEEEGEDQVIIHTSQLTTDSSRRTILMDLGCRSFDGQAYVGTPSGVIRCRTVRQLSAQERWDTEFVLSIKGTPWSPDGECARDVNILVDLPAQRCASARY